MEIVILLDLCADCVSKQNIKGKYSHSWKVDNQKMPIEFM